MKGLIQNQEEVKALLEGKKTMFRVPMKEDLLPNCFDYQCLGEIKDGVFEFENNTGGFNHIKAPYKVGERVFVKETYRICAASSYTPTNGKHKHDVTLEYKSTYENPINWNRGGRTVIVPKMNFGSNLRKDGGVAWTPSIHMPEWASRITLTIESVGVEQLGKIGEKDAKREGVDPSPYCDGFNTSDYPYQSAFRDYWQQKYGSYDPSLWVWKYGVKVEVKK